MKCKYLLFEYIVLILVKRIKSKIFFLTKYLSFDILMILTFSFNINFWVNFFHFLAADNLFKFVLQNRLIILALLRYVKYLDFLYHIVKYFLKRDNGPPLASKNLYNISVTLSIDSSVIGWWIPLLTSSLKI